MKLTDRINNLLHPLMLRYVRYQYRKKMAVNKRKHPEAFVCPERSVVEEHLRLWRPLMRNVNPIWLKMFYGISGRPDPRFVPEDVFYGVIERCLDNCDACGAYVEDKNDVCFYIPREYQPRSIVRYDRGVFFDADFNPIPIRQVYDIFASYSYPIVGKPSMNSCGGSNVRIWNPGEVDVAWVTNSFQGYLFQEILRQETTVAAFNPASVNTCRIMTFRRPWSGEVSVIAGMLRLGCSNEIADNLALGGISADIDNSGRLAAYGVDHDFGKYSKHPISNKPFEGFEVPYYGRLGKVACDIAKRIPGYNLLSFDMIAREDGSPCVIEINATSMTLAQLQTVRPLFGDETEQVIEWCASHRHLDVFNHFRTWY